MAEVVGIVLAIAPLVISVIENYENTVKCVRAFKGYTSLISTHLRTLNVQQTIFRKANERLLSPSIVDEDHARQMLANPKHPSWEDDAVATLYRERLGDAEIAFGNAIELICESLERIRTILVSLDAPENKPSKQLRKKLKYVMKQSDIEHLLSDLRERTRDFDTLVTQTDEVPHRVPNHRLSPTLKKQVSNFLQVKNTANDLYEALGQACTKHSSHQASLSLEPVYDDPSQIQFTLAFSQLRIDQTKGETDQFSKSTWLTIESSVSGRVQTHKSDTDLVAAQTHLKRAFEDSAGCETRPLTTTSSVIQHKSRKKCLRFEDEMVDSIVLANPKLSVPLSNLCMHSNFCNYISKFVNQSQPSRSAVGYLEISASSKHLIYVDNKSQTVKSGSPLSELASLHDVLFRTSTPRRSTSIPDVQRVRLARQLATAVLHFHATPWLTDSWHSQSVLLSYDDPIEHSDRSNWKAYMTVQIQGPKRPSIQVQSPPSPIVVRNRLLFRLGVMLLEIAYQRPLRELAIDRDRSDVPGTSEYLTADRLSREVSRKMGFKYAVITRKCIHCDFGCDFDLKDTKLQEGFYQDVLCELDKLELLLGDL